MDPRFREEDGFTSVIPLTAPSFLSDSSFLHPRAVIPA